jgi:hypothetical protein
VAPATCAQALFYLRPFQAGHARFDIPVRAFQKVLRRAVLAVGHNGLRRNAGVLLMGVQSRFEPVGVVHFAVDKIEINRPGDIAERVIFADAAIEGESGVKKVFLGGVRRPIMSQFPSMRLNCSSIIYNITQ